MKPEAQRLAIAAACGYDVAAERKRLELCRRDDVNPGKSPIPDYLHDLDAASEFAKHLASIGWFCCANMGLDGTWGCFFTSKPVESVIPGTDDHYGAGNTLSQAICEAGLRAIGQWVEETESQPCP